MRSTNLTQGSHPTSTTRPADFSDENNTKKNNRKKAKYKPNVQLDHTDPTQGVVHRTGTTRPMTSSTKDHQSGFGKLGKSSCTAMSFTLARIRFTVVYC